MRDLGYTVIATEDGDRAALEYEAHHGRIALAILDVMMPELGGVQAYERMRAVDPKVKVLFTTGYAPDNAQVSHLVSDRGHALLVKPFTLNELGTRVRELLDAGS